MASKLIRWGGIAALIGGSAWIIKFVLILLTAANPLPRPVYALLFLIGYLLPAGLALALAAQLGTGRTWLTIILFPVLLVVGLLAIGIISEGIAGIVQSTIQNGPDYLPTELPLLLFGLIGAAIGYILMSRTRTVSMARPS